MNHPFKFKFKFKFIEEVLDAVVVRCLTDKTWVSFVLFFSCDLDALNVLMIVAVEGSFPMTWSCNRAFKVCPNQRKMEVKPICSIEFLSSFGQKNPIIQRSHAMDHSLLRSCNLLFCRKTWLALYSACK